VGVKVITDSSSDLPDDLVDQLGIGVVPLTVRFGTEEFVDRRDLTPAEFWARCDASATLPETAAPSPGAFEAAFRGAAADGHDGKTLHLFFLSVREASDTLTFHQRLTLVCDMTEHTWGVAHQGNRLSRVVEGL